MLMKQSMRGVAKRLIFSLFVVSGLGGCAAYGPPNPGPYAYGTDANGQPVYAAPYYPYYYDPLYIGEPVFLIFGFHSFSAHRHHDRGCRGGQSRFRGTPGAGSGPGDRQLHDSTTWSRRSTRPGRRRV